MKNDIYHLSGVNAEVSRNIPKAVLTMSDTNAGWGRLGTDLTPDDKLQHYTGWNTENNALTKHLDNQNRPHTGMYIESKSNALT